MLPRPPESTLTDPLFPYTTLVRPEGVQHGVVEVAAPGRGAQDAAEGRADAVVAGRGDREAFRSGGAGHGRRRGIVSGRRRGRALVAGGERVARQDRKSTRLNSSH